MFDLIALAYPGQPDARGQLHDGRRGQQPAVQPHRHLRCVPSAVAPPEQPGEDGAPGEDADLSQPGIREVREEAAETPDGDGSMLDNSIVLFGSNMSNSNLHDHFPLPTAIVGGGCGKLKGNQHLRYPDHTPIANVHLALLQRTGIPPSRSAIASGRWRSEVLRAYLLTVACWLLPWCTAARSAAHRSRARCSGTMTRWHGSPQRRT